MFCLVYWFKWFWKMFLVHHWGFTLKFIFMRDNLFTLKVWNMIIFYVEEFTSEFWLMLLHMHSSECLVFGIMVFWSSSKLWLYQVKLDTSSLFSFEFPIPCYKTLDYHIYRSFHSSLLGPSVENEIFVSLFRSLFNQLGIIFWVIFIFFFPEPLLLYYGCCECLILAPG